MRYLAHIAGDGRVQTVAEHLRGTGALAAGFASAFGGEEDAYLAGTLHDIGKYTPEFQARLQGGAVVDHATAGAVEACALRKLPVALAIAGHHGGIPDFGNLCADTADDPTFCGRIKRKVSPDPIWRQECPPPASHAPVWLSDKDFPSYAFYTRMLYSCLVDGDFQDTQNFMNGTPSPRGQYASLEALLSKVRHPASQYLQTHADSTVCQQRNRVLQACLEKGQSVPRGLYTLTVPTGGGKTFASLAFGLEHAVRQGMSRIIYVIPYTSIIDQTAEVFTRLLGEENVLAHYYGAEYQLSEPEELTVAQYKKLLASENWDAPVVVTTAVQFFESLYSNRSSRCRKLHNMANSVIIFDEAQTLPIDYLHPCLYAIGELVRHYNATAVLCTATQPAVEPLFKELVPELSMKELCPDDGSLRTALSRTVLEDMGQLTKEALGQMLQTHEQVLCVVNKRKTAQELFHLLPQEGSFCLTTLLCPHHRKKQIEEIRLRLQEGRPCRVVSTSLIEAGVDVDFPTAYREDCGLDSLLQTAGRCNREGKRPRVNSRVYRFSLEGCQPPLMLSKNRSALQYAARRCENLDSPEAIQTYFAELFSLKGEALDKKGIMEALTKGIEGGRLPFRQIADRFRLIETDTCPVYLPFGEGEAICDRLRQGELSRVLFRKLGQYSVDCYSVQFKALDAAGALELLPDGGAILLDTSMYDPCTGLSLDAENGIGIFI